MKQLFSQLPYFELGPKKFELSYFSSFPPQLRYFFFFPPSYAISNFFPPVKLF